MIGSERPGSGYARKARPRSVHAGSANRGNDLYPFAQRLSPVIFCARLEIAAVIEEDAAGGVGGRTCERPVRRSRLDRARSIQGQRLANGPPGIHATGTSWMNVLSHSTQSFIPPGHSTRPRLLTKGLVDVVRRRRACSVIGALIAILKYAICPDITVSEITVPQRETLKNAARLA